jgi:pyruvyltransferase
MKPVNANWCLSPNFGDQLTPYIIEKYTGQKPFWLDLKNGELKIVAVGSIMNWCDPSCVVWGAGLSGIDQGICRDVIVRAVRGPLTRQVAVKNHVECPEVYGDPALVLPRIYKPKQVERKGLGIIPHYAEQHLAWDLIDGKEDVKYINVFDNVEKVIDDICSCQAILSSSLHGLIVADAYGIPSEWLVISNQIQGDGTKYYDYYLSIDAPRKKGLALREIIKKDTKYILASIKKNEIKPEMVDKLIEVKPF